MGKRVESKKENSEGVIEFEHRCFDHDWVEEQYQKYLKNKKTASH